jgi:hypothetical protein
MGDMVGRERKPGASTLVQDAAVGRDAIGPGKRTLVEQIPSSSASAASGGAVVQRQTETGTKPPEETEKAGTSLYAKDDKGKDLPPSIEDVKQGGLNDCYAFAAMAAIVHSDPNKIIGMIKDNGNESYTVTFQGTGVFSSDKQTVTADFVKGKHGKVGVRNAFWPLVIEKAYGQNKGGIAEMDKGGNPGTAIDDFVDMGPSRFDPRDKDNDYIMAKLAKAQADKKPTTLATPKEDEASKEKKEMKAKIPGLYFWHGYVVVGADEKGKRIKLHNPWGYDHPNGDGWVPVDVIHTFFIECTISG